MELEDLELSSARNRIACGFGTMANFVNGPWSWIPQPDGTYLEVHESGDPTKRTFNHEDTREFGENWSVK